MTLFFWSVGAVAAAFGIAITLTPIGWARRFGWPISPEGSLDQRERNLSLYFGRCLGVLVLAFAVTAFAAAASGNPPRLLLLFAVLLGAGLTGVHIYGAIRRIQPIIETIEIAFYGGLTVWGLVLYLG